MIWYAAMSGVTLAEAKANLAAWLAADKAIAEGGQSYSIGDRSLTRADAATIRESISYWQRAVNSLEAESLGARSPMASYAKFT